MALPNVLVEWLSYILMWIAGLVSSIFPADPFISHINSLSAVQYVQQGMQFLNWFLPFNSLASTVALVLGCILSLYAIKLCKWVIDFVKDSIPNVVPIP